jgi:hypothetical protein
LENFISRPLRLVYGETILKINTNPKNESILSVRAVLSRELVVLGFDFSLKTIGASPKSINFETMYVRATIDINKPYFSTPRFLATSVIEIRVNISSNDLPPNNERRF